MSRQPRADDLYFDPSALRDQSLPEHPHDWSGVQVDPSSLAVVPFLAFANLLRRYHRYRVEHLERLGNTITAGRRVIVVSNHALDLVDPLLFVATVLERYERIPRFIGHENFVFRIPGLRAVATNWQVIPSRQPEETARALEKDKFLMLFPGAGTEALMRDYHRDAYRLKWEGRTGFLRLALEHDADIIFAAAVGNDDMYYQSRWPVPDSYLRFINAGDAERYEGARLQFGVLGPHLFPALLPLPVQLTHHVSEPLDLGDRERALHDEAAFGELHEDIWARCQTFLDSAVDREHATSDCLDRTVRAYTGMLAKMGF